MKALLVVLFISLASLYICAEPIKYCEDIITPGNNSICYNASLKEGYYKCCYENYYVGIASHPSCVQLTKDNYTNLDKFKEYRKSLSPLGQNFTLECQTSPTPSNSNYITISLLSLIFLLL